MVHTFKEGVDILRKIMDVFCRDTSYDIVYDVIEPARGIVLDDRSLTVETFPLYHRVPAVGYLFKGETQAAPPQGAIWSNSCRFPWRSCR